MLVTLAWPNIVERRPRPTPTSAVSGVPPWVPALLSSDCDCDWMAPDAKTWSSPAAVSVRGVPGIPEGEGRNPTVRGRRSAATCQTRRGTEPPSRLQELSRGFVPTGTSRSEAPNSSTAYSKDGDCATASPTAAAAYCSSLQAGVHKFLWCARRAPSTVLNVKCGTWRSNALLQQHAVRRDAICL